MRGLTVVQRIIIGFSLLGGVLVAIGTFSLNSLSQIVEKNDSAYFELLPFVSQSQVVPQKLYQLQNELGGFLFEDPPSQATQTQIAIMQTALDDSYKVLVDRMPSSFESGSLVNQLNDTISATSPQVNTVVATVLSLRSIEQQRLESFTQFTEQWQSQASSLQRLQVGASASAARGYRQFDRLVGPVLGFADELLAATSLESGQEAVTGLQNSLTAMQPIIDRLSGQSAPTAELSGIQTLLAQFLSGEEGFYALQTSLFTKRAELVTNLLQWRQLIATTENEIDQLGQAVSNYASGEQAQTQATAARVRTWTIGSIVAALLVAILIAWRSMQSIRNPLNSSLSALEQVSSGDFTVRLEARGRDEFSQIGSFVNQLVEELATSITELRKNAQSLANSASDSRHQAATSKDQAGHQKDQAQSIATAINQMESAVGEVANATNEAREEVDRVKQLANAGEHSMQTNIQTINQLDGKVHSAGEVIALLAKQTEQITQILDVIGGIAEQTNLLALNAAIEAARAGESGRGFAVVADEVRGLADKTHTSTGEIQSMISGLVSATEQAKHHMDSAAESMVLCVDQSEVTAKAMQDIDAAMSAVQDMSTQIATAAEEQTLVAGEVNKNIVEVADLAEQAYQRANKGAEDSEYVSQLAVQQNKLMEKFKC